MDDDLITPDGAIMENAGALFLQENEVILAVDDVPEVLRVLSRFMEEMGMPLVEADSVAAMDQALAENDVALVLLDIDLPDGLGCDILPRIKAEDQDLSVVMLTALADLEMAMHCMRRGADDFIAKPVRPEELRISVVRALERRWLARENRRYQQELEQTQYRTTLLHRLTARMNSVYLGSSVLEEILLAILVGITAAEGLCFNRAFLLLFDQEGNLNGELAIGPACSEEAGRVWDDIARLHLGFQELVSEARKSCLETDAVVNRIVRDLRVDAARQDHLLMRVARERRSILVREGMAEGREADQELIERLGCATFVAAPLMAPDRPLGVIVADNFITRAPIPPDLVQALEIFAGHASVAIEHSRLHLENKRKIAELERITRELDSNKDRLVRSERYSAIGQMAGRLVHRIRNPITSLGGTARMLERRIQEPKWKEFLSMMASEASRVEATLDDLFSFIENGHPRLTECHLSALVQEALKQFYQDMVEQGIRHEFSSPGDLPAIPLDDKQIIQLVQHLLRNALEAMPGGGSLEIRVEEGEGRQRLVLCDSGEGFSPEALDRADEPFFTTRPHGPGMGLALARRIAGDHGGCLSWENRREGGARVVVEFPLDGEALEC